ncbi:Glutathione synthetase [Candidatus Erwinia haradaeae]|uniref:Glutathione synthetase n=1 Tax=Candidatus Erwinia haradaeae TaxID=1922217 RepID=A0A451DJB9_9GAMM|nr:glutathione synthase [Candidatus Erwinia haradaeae]VFP86782.1 Glutathione synthetase [Candidatus Erwinia haradaeae]
MIKLGVVMDPITSIDFKKDSSIAMLIEAQLRGYAVYYMEMSDLYLYQGEGRAYTRLININIQNNNSPFFSLKNEQDIALSSLDVILMRKNPPLDTEFLYSTYILERAEEQGVLIINKPQSLRDCNEKLFTLWFSDLAPETLVTRNATKIREFWHRHHEIIIKPLDGMGGVSIFRIKQNDLNMSVILETMTRHGSVYCVSQEYLPSISDGDKRVLVIDGQPVPYCLARIPKVGETRGNLAAGGYGEVRMLSESDIKIVNRVSPILQQKGLIFVGLDIIGNKLTEINVTSPTCICEIERTVPISISGLLMDVIEQRLTKCFL